MQTFWFKVALAATAFIPSALSVSLNPDDESSIKGACATYAQGLMSFYKNNASTTPPEKIGVFPDPHYWWESGAIWGGIAEYTALTGDSSYEDTLIQALVANTGPERDIILPWQKGQEGNDDQAFWAFAFMSAAEYEVKNPKESDPQYIEVVKRAFDNIVGRWDTTSCNGGLKWQIYPENAYGYNYKNSVSNGAVFSLATRLARYTGDKKYADWAEKIWDWITKVGLVTDKFEVYDGTGDKENCTKMDANQWSYNIALFLHGSAGMYDFTKGSDIWQKRTQGFLDHAAIFFENDIMFEVNCEKIGKCNNDQLSFKAYLSRFMAKTALLAPFTKDKITNYLRKSALGAATSCVGGPDGTTCGSQWALGSFDKVEGMGQQLSALEVTQSLLLLKEGRLPTVEGDQKPEPSPSASPSATSSLGASSAPASSTPVPISPVASSILVTISSAGPAVPASSKESSAEATPAPPSSQGTPSTPLLPSTLDASIAPGPPRAPSLGTQTVGSTLSTSIASSTALEAPAATAISSGVEGCDCDSTVTITSYPITVTRTLSRVSSGVLPSSTNGTALVPPSPTISAPLQVTTNAAVDLKMPPAGIVLGALVAIVGWI